MTKIYTQNKVMYIYFIHILNNFLMNIRYLMRRLYRNVKGQDFQNIFIQITFRAKHINLR